MRCQQISKIVGRDVYAFYSCVYGSIAVIECSDREGEGLACVCLFRCVIYSCLRYESLVDVTRDVPISRRRARIQGRNLERLGRITCGLSDPI